MREAWEVCKEAIEKGELKEYFNGEENYRRISSPMLNTQGEVDEGLLLYGFNELIKKEMNENYIKNFYETIILMLSGNIKELRRALNYIGLQLKNESKGISSFTIENKKVMEYIKQVLYKRKEELERVQISDRLTAWNIVEMKDDNIVKITGRHIL